jgi:chromate transporter
VDVDETTDNERGDTTNGENDIASPADRFGFGRILAYFLKLGAVGFGGPIATVDYMQRDLVEQRHWIAAGALGLLLH